MLTEYAIPELFEKFWDEYVDGPREIDGIQVTGRKQGSLYVVESDENMYDAFPGYVHAMLKRSNKLPKPKLIMNEVYKESVCKPYCQTLPFVICNSLQHFWVVFDRNDTGEQVYDLLDSGIAVTLTEDDHQNHKWDILRKSSMLHQRCCEYDGMKPDPDDGFWVPRVRSSGDCGVDVVRHICMMNEARGESKTNFRNMSEYDGCKKIRRDLIDNPPPPSMNERTSENPMTADTEDDAGREAIF